MKLLGTLLLLLGLSTSLWAQQSGSVRRLDESNGFRGLPFGAPLTEGLHLKLIQDSGDEKIYERTDEDLRLGSFSATRIHYKFFQGQFAAVTIIVKGADQAQRVLPAFQSIYGPGRMEGFSCKWQGEQVGLSFASWSADNAILAMSSLPLTVKMKQAKSAGKGPRK
ncbi:hypothetical protein SAMN06265337_1126 [Hymenobacter gelipurpurascens]|uniref:Uncharacterized protein n=1 Tax=Hymenobacter gelipurpurascens TaxID=89968 RepID=A0A212TF20_9BACT|nr:hypothetical protein [Hymenobacter gelipurpurascens]SNC64668.1 hypothetical protein SAMN06265337_1126 [Hymenobacter gelipurpurascens]